MDSQNVKVYLKNSLGYFKWNADKILPRDLPGIISMFHWNFPNPKCLNKNLDEIVTDFPRIFRFWSTTFCEAIFIQKFGGSLERPLWVFNRVAFGTVLARLKRQAFFRLSILDLNNRMKVEQS